MVYRCEIGKGQWIELENIGSQTHVTIGSSHPGQQQQASSSFATGVWSGAPQVLRTAKGIVIKLNTEQGERLLQIQNGVSALVNALPQGIAQPLRLQYSETSASTMEPIKPIESMKPMKPMEPMSLGDMQMGLKPMMMQMGNMMMQMGTTRAEEVPKARSFCTHCSNPLAGTERFCSHCGQAIERC